jgi:hypothetical protein
MSAFLNSMREEATRDELFEALVETVQERDALRDENARLQEALAARDLKKAVRRMRFWMLVVSVYALGFLLVWGVERAWPHDIYTGLHGKDAQLCCGGKDCFATVYRESGGGFEFLTRERHWVPIPEDRITFLPVPGDEKTIAYGDTYHAHLCFRDPKDTDWAHSANILHGKDQVIYFYCAFIPPGAI